MEQPSYKDAKYYSTSTEAQKAKKGDAPEGYWWDKENHDQAQAIWDRGRAIYNRSLERHAGNIRHARLYENVDLSTLTGTDVATAITRQAILGNGLVSLNVVAAATDTLTAKIAKNKPRPMFVTSMGNWKQQRIAKKLDRWARGVFYETKIYEKARRIFVDACVYGTGFLHVYLGSDGRLVCERALSDEMFVDDNDGFYGEPRQLYRRKRVQKEVLANEFPDFADEIMKAKPPSEIGMAQLPPNVVEVWEAWHLPSGEGAKDGRHVMAIQGCALVNEAWNACSFPFVVLRRTERTVGFWGKGIAEALMGIQLELNRLVRSVSEQLRRKGKGRTFVQIGSKVVSAHLTNGIGDIIQYSGAPPVVDNQNAVSQEEFLQIDRLYQRAFQEVGISELSAAAKKPSGLDAAVALREYSDIESERFALAHLGWEIFFLDFIELCIELMEDQYKKKNGKFGYKVKVPGKRTMETVDFSDVHLSRDSYVLQMFPVSSLPSTPAARYQRVREMLADGFITPAIAQRLLDFPDIETETSLAVAAIDDVDYTISKILDEDVPEFLPVEPYQNLDLLVSRGTAAYLFARQNNAEESRMQMLRQLIDDATQARLASMPQPPQQPGSAPPEAGGNTQSMSGANMGNMNINVAGPQATPVAPPVVA